MELPSELGNATDPYGYSTENFKTNDIFKPSGAAPMAR
jgi:hypothetical protein